jgi:hypothetical protein
MLLAFGRVLDILGEPSRSMIIAKIQNKHTSSDFLKSALTPISLTEIEEAIRNAVPIGSELIVKMFEAEYRRLELE